MLFYLFLTLTVVWFIFMTWLSHQNGEHTSETSLGLAEKLAFLNADIQELNGQLRRLAHVTVFLVFTLLLGLTLYYGKKPMRILLLAAFWAWADERTKPLIEGRHFSWFDVGLNFLGMAVGALLLAGWIIFAK